MEPLPPDPYEALGVPTDATVAQVRTAYRKLVLKCHPDKVTDPEAKEAAKDKFHLIQTSYEILIDDDKRLRYHAMVSLAQKRKDKATKPPKRSSSPYRSSHDTGPGRERDRPPPQYEVRTPPGVPTDYFDSQPRTSGRRESRDYEYVRSSRRATPDAKEKVRPHVREAKERDSVRADRKEKERKAERETRRERERKYSRDDHSDSSFEEYVRRPRRRKEESAERMAAKETYYEHARRQREEAESGVFADDRARKLFSQHDDARAYIQQASRSRPRPDDERRPSAARTSDDDRYYSSKPERPSTGSRQASGRPPTSGQEGESRRYARRPSVDIDDRPRHPPGFTSWKSEPADIRIPSDKQRSYSLQPDSDAMPAMPSMPRAETMPYPRRSDNSVPTRNSNLRPTEMAGGMPTPSATPEYAGPSGSTKYQYGRQYADDVYVPTPDGYRPSAEYRTEYREPASSSRPAFARKVTRSPSPGPREIRESREKSRTTSSRYESGSSARPSISSRQASRSYFYTAPGQPITEATVRASRPSTATRTSGERPLFGEVGRGEGLSPRPGTDSPRHQQGPFPLPNDEPYLTRPILPERRTTSSRRSTVDRGRERPSLSRQGSTAIYGRA